jgi:hypothetical protein
MATPEPGLLRDPGPAVDSHQAEITHASPHLLRRHHPDTRARADESTAAAATLQQVIGA